MNDALGRNSAQLLLVELCCSKDSPASVFAFASSYSDALTPAKTEDLFPTDISNGILAAAA